MDGFRAISEDPSKWQMVRCFVFSLKRWAAAETTSSLGSSKWEMAALMTWFSAWMSSVVWFESRCRSPLLLRIILLRPISRHNNTEMYFRATKMPCLDSHALSEVPATSWAAFKQWSIDEMMRCLTECPSILSVNSMNKTATSWPAVSLTGATTPPWKRDDIVFFSSVSSIKNAPEKSPKRSSASNAIDRASKSCDQLRGWTEVSFRAACQALTNANSPKSDPWRTIHDGLHMLYKNSVAKRYWESSWLFLCFVETLWNCSTSKSCILEVERSSDFLSTSECNLFAFRGRFRGFLWESVNARSSCCMKSTSLLTTKSSRSPNRLASCTRCHLVRSCTTESCSLTFDIISFSISCS